MSSAIKMVILLQEAEGWGGDAVGYSCKSNIIARTPVVTDDDQTVNCPDPFARWFVAYLRGQADYRLELQYHYSCHDCLIRRLR